MSAWKRGRQTKAQEGTTDHIPLEIWEEILTRIPAKELIELKVVCKSWCNLIGNKDFGQRHLDYGRCRRCHNVMVRRSDTQVLTYDFDKGTSSRMFSKVQSKKWYKHLVPSVKLDCRDLKLYFSKHHNVLDSCDGLLLISLEVVIRDHPVRRRFPYDHGRQDLLVINPATNLQKHLHVKGGVHISSWKIVYDASSKCYKVFGIEFIKKNSAVESPNRNAEISCSIYELRGGEKEWNLPQSRSIILEGISFGYDPVKSLSVKGKEVHWLISERLLLSMDVASYDLKYNFFPLPRGIKLSWCFTSNETFHCPIRADTELQLWALEDLDQSPTWVKHRTITTVNIKPTWPTWTVPLKCIGNTLIVVLEDKQVYRIDMSSGQKKKIMDHPDVDIPPRSRPRSYQNVVSVDQVADSLISTWD